MEKSTREKLVRYTLFAVGAVVVSPIVFMAIKGIIGLAVAALILLLIVQFAPVISMKVANMKVKAIKAQASANPIETLQNQWIQKQQELNAMIQSVTVFATETKNYEAKVKEFSAKFPSKATEFQTQAIKMQKVVDMQRVKVQQAQKGLSDFQGQIEEASAVWDMTQASAVAMKSMAKFSNEDVLEKIKSQTAIDAVTSSLNQTMAELETFIQMDYNTLDANFNVVSPAPALTVVPQTTVEPAFMPAPTSVSKPAYRGLNRVKTK